jgi:hypothetical protein
MILQTSTPAFEKSLEFYARLGYTVVEDTPFVTDGQVIIEINQDRYARPGIKLFSNDWQDVVARLPSHYQPLATKFGYLLMDNGTWIYLVEEQFSLKVKSHLIPPSSLGKYAGVSLEVLAVDKAFEIWKLLGFKKTSGDTSKGWITIENESGFTISLMKPLVCPHLFVNPSLTYFNGSDNLAIIDEVRRSGVPIEEEVTHFNQDGIVDNLVLRDPGGLGIFVFND